MATPENTVPEAEQSAPAAPSRGRVRLRRLALMAIPTLAASATLSLLTAQGVLAAQFSISGMPFTVTASNLQGDGFEQFGGMDTMIENSPNGARPAGRSWSWSLPSGPRP